MILIRFARLSGLNLDKNHVNLANLIKITVQT